MASARGCAWGAGALADLRVRQGRLEEAEQLLDGVDVNAEVDAARPLAAIHLARGQTALAHDILVVAMVALLAGGCDPVTAPAVSGGPGCRKLIRQDAADYLNFVQLNGITYSADRPVVGRTLGDGELGPVHDRVRCLLRDKMDPTRQQPQDGDAWAGRVEVVQRLGSAPRRAGRPSAGSTCGGRPASTPAGSTHRGPADRCAFTPWAMPFMAAQRDCLSRPAQHVVRS